MITFFNKVIYSLCFLCLFCSSVEATIYETTTKEGKFTAEVEWNLTQLEIQQILEIQLRLRFPQSFNVDLKKVNQQIMMHHNFVEAPFEIKSVTNEEKIVDQYNQVHISYQLTPKLLGEHYLSFYGINFTAENTNLVTIYTAPVKITIMPPSQVVDSIKIISFITTPELELNRYNELLFWQNLSYPKGGTISFYLSFAAFFILIFILGNKQSLAVIEDFIYRRRVRKNPIESINKIVRISDSTERYLQLSGFMKRTIASKHQISINSLTEEEVSRRFKPLVDERLTEFLEIEEKIKFARYQATEVETQELKHFIDERLLNK